MSSDDDEYIIARTRNRQQSDKSNIKIRFLSSSDEENQRVSIQNQILSSVRFNKDTEGVETYRRPQFFTHETDSDSEEIKTRPKIFDSDEEVKPLEIRKTSIKQDESPVQIEPPPRKNSQAKYDFSTHVITPKPISVPNTLIGSIKQDKSASLDPTLSQTRTMLKENLTLKSTLSKTYAELKFLVDKYEDKPGFKETIDRFLSDKPYWFDLYKNKRDKISILNEAVASQDGNSILATVLYLKRTLNKDIFHEILVNNTTALNQYTFYLKQMNEIDELVSIEKFQKNPIEIATLLNFYKVLTDRQLELNEKMRLFHEFERNLSLNEIIQVKNSQVYQSALKHLTLLKIQKEIYKNRSSFYRREQVKQDAMDNLNEQTLSYTVTFCLKFQKDLTDNPLYSIDHFKKEFDFTPKEYSIWFIKSMSESSQWSEIEKFLNQKTFFQKQSVRYETIVCIIHSARGGDEQLKKYLSQVDDLENRRLLAIKLKLYDLVIESFKLQKDRIGLYNFRNTFKEDSSEYIKSSILLKDDKIKWKN